MAIEFGIFMTSMEKETVYDILLDYLEQRKNAQLDSVSIKKRLARIGKTEDQIYEFMIEFDDEWDREMQYMQLLKKAKFNLYGGSILALVFAIISVFSALKIITIGGLSMVFYGAVATGLVGAIWGSNTIKMYKLRDERLKIKYLNR